MNFLDLQNKVLTDRFASTRREDAKAWINYRYGRLWSADDWSFKRGVGTVTLNAGQQTASFTGFQRILGLWDATTSPLFSALDALRPEDYYRDASLTTGTPYGFTIVGSTIRFTTPATSTRTFNVIGELSFTPLVLDGDTPLIPVEFHQALVSGAQAQGLREENDPTWKDLEADYQAAIEDMRKSYLVQVRNFKDVYPDWPPYY